MASKNPQAPVCPKCNHSNGITVDVTTTIVWKNGDWRWFLDPDMSDLDGGVSCTNCGFMTNDINYFHSPSDERT